jgi:hypothetical protein
MAKVDLDIVKYVLERTEQLEPRQVAGVIEQIAKEQKMLDAEKTKEPAVKKQFVMIVSDPQGELPAKDFVGWVAQIPEDESAATTEERIHRAVYEFNTTPRGRRMPVETIGEACEAVSPRIFKEQQIWIKTKEPVLLLKSKNKIPMDDLKKASREDI